MIPTPEEFEEWRQHPVTRAVMEVLRDRREWAKESLIICQAFVSEHSLGWDRGRAEAIQSFLTDGYEEYFGGGD